MSSGGFFSSVAVYARSVSRYIILDVLSSYYVSSDSFKNAPRVHFIYLHHLHDSEVSDFRRLIEWLISQGVVFVSHSRAVEMLDGSDLKGIYVSISFDDGLKSCVRASRVMDEYSIKGCFFVNGSMVGECDRAKVAEFSRVRLNMDPVEFMDWSDLESLFFRGHEIGNHTFSHSNCALLDMEMFEEEFILNHNVIAENIGAPIHFAWPYGRAHDVNKEQLEFVQNFGYKSSSSAVRGCHSTGVNHDCFFLYREHVMLSWPLRHIKYFLVRSALD